MKRMFLLKWKIRPPPPPRINKQENAFARQDSLEPVLFHFTFHFFGLLILGGGGGRARHLNFDQKPSLSF